MGRHQKAESGGLISALVAALVGWIAIRVYIVEGTASMLQEVPLDIVSALTICCIAICAFMVGYSRLARSLTVSHGKFVVLRRLFELLSLSVIYGFAVFMVSYLLIVMIKDVLHIDLPYDYLVALVVIASGGIGYFAYVQGQLLTAKAIASQLPIFVIAGAGTAGISSTDPNWWQNNFSELGDNVTPAATLFNITLIMTGVCVIIISYFAIYELIASHEQYKQWNNDIRNYKQENLREMQAELADAVIPDSQEEYLTAVKHKNNGEKMGIKSRFEQWFNQDKNDSLPYFNVRTTLLLILLCTTGVLLSGVGVFRYSWNPFMHNFCAHGMVIPVGILLLFLPWIAPQLSKMVYVMSYLVVIGLSYAGLLYLKGTMTMTNVEALAWLLFMAWFIVFSRQVAAIEADRVYDEIKYHDGVEKVTANS